MLAATRELLNEAQAGGFAVGAFNVYNLEGVKAAIAAAEAEHAPVMLQIHPKALEYGGPPLVALCLEAARRSTVRVAVHLDHCSDPDAIRSALEAGMASVMADGSALDYNDNLAFTREMAALAHKHDAGVEAELGMIAGTEDGLTVQAIQARMTDPQQAAEFVSETGVDALAVCIGNVHGAYPGDPQLDFDRLAQIRRSVRVPLVLHGTSGLPDAMIRQAIGLGVTKFNVNTEVRRAYLDVLRSAPDGDLLDVMAAAVDAMQAVIAAKIRLFMGV